MKIECDQSTALNSQSQTNVDLEISVNTEPCLTVLTPVYNGEEFIGKCIQSVIAQNCPSVEHLIIDAASTDGTLDIVKQYAAQYPHIRWISEADRGQSDALNKGAALARGSILGILNVDDYYEPDVFNQIIKVFETLPTPSFVVGNCTIRNEKQEILGENCPKRLKLKELLMGSHINPFPYNPVAYFYHTHLHEVAGPYDVDDHYAMDLDFILRAVRFAHVKYIDKNLGNYLYYPGTKSFQSNVDNKTKARIDVLMRKYRKFLSPIDRLRAIASYEYYSNEGLRRIKSLIKSRISR